MGLILFGGGGAQAATTTGWQVAGFSGVRVKAVAVHPYRRNEVAVALDGEVKISHDGGLLWTDSPLHQQVNALAYDSARFGWMYAATDTGVYITRDNGVSWQLLDSVTTAHLVVSQIIAAGNYVYIDAQGGAGTTTFVYRIAVDSGATQVILLTDNGNGLAYDKDQNRLYVGTRGGVYVSLDNGNTVEIAGTGSGAFSSQMAVSNGVVWELTLDGLFSSHDGGTAWQQVTSIRKIDDQIFGTTLRPSGGLVGNNARAFYGEWDPFDAALRYLAEFSDGTTKSILDAQVTGLANGGDRLWAATASGVWVNDGLVSREVAIHRPVIVIPGILGSLPTVTGTVSSIESKLGGIWDGIWGDDDEQPTATPLALDPIRHTYDGLLQSLQDHGFELNRTLFPFPYNWMRDNTKTADQLRQRIAQVKQVCGCSQVDIVAHSMGGLVARSYIQGTTYNNDVHNLIQIATPNVGGVDAFAAWEGGEYSGLGTDSGNAVVDLLGSVLAGDASEGSKTLAVRHTMPSIQQLLPVFDYIVGRHYPSGYPVNPFLEQLNQAAAVELLKRRVSVYTVGSDNHPTLASLRLGDPQFGGLVWPDGKIIGSTTSAGDGTVLRSSLEWLAPLGRTLTGDHGQVVDQSAGFVLSILLGVDEASPVAATQAPTPLVIAASSNVALKVSDAAGRSAGDQAGGIPGAYASGTATSLRLVALPQDSLGSYIVTLTAPSAVEASGSVGATGSLYAVGAVDLAAMSSVAGDVYGFGATDGAIGRGSAAASTQPTIIRGLIHPGESVSYRYIPELAAFVPVSSLVAGSVQEAGLAASTASAPTAVFGVFDQYSRSVVDNSTTKINKYADHNPGIPIIPNSGAGERHLRRELSRRGVYLVLGGLVLLVVLAIGFYKNKQRNT